MVPKGSSWSGRYRHLIRIWFVRQRGIQRHYPWNKQKINNLTQYFIISGKGDLVGCDITKHWEGAAAHDDVVVKSSADVRALTYCDIKRIHIPGLVDVLKLYPEFQERFAEEVCHDLTYNLREGYDADVSFILDFLLGWNMAWS